VTTSSTGDLNLLFSHPYKTTSTSSDMTLHNDPSLNSTSSLLCSLSIPHTSIYRHKRYFKAINDYDMWWKLEKRDYKGMDRK